MTPLGTSRPESLVPHERAYSRDVDDTSLHLELHASTVDLLRVPLTALEEMSNGTTPTLTADLRSYLSQAMDIAADLNIVFGELADVFVNATDPHAATREA
jgi:hypothetical protein